MKIQTIYGEIEERELDKAVLVEPDRRIVEYRLGGELVHRSVESGLVPLVPAGGEMASFG